MQIFPLKIKYVVMHFNQFRNKLQNPENVVIGHVNVNSLRNKSDTVEEQYKMRLISTFSLKKEKK